jgi:hypothetical protein
MPAPERCSKDMNLRLISCDIDHKTGHGTGYIIGRYVQAFARRNTTCPFVGIPEHLIEDAIADGRLVRMNVAVYALMPRHIYLIGRRDYNIGTAGQTIWECMTSGE